MSIYQKPPNDLLSNGGVSQHTIMAQAAMILGSKSQQASAEPTLTRSNLSTFFWHAVRYVLDNPHPWSFANRYIPLNKVMDEVGGYAIPADCIKKHAVGDKCCCYLEENEWYTDQSRIFVCCDICPHLWYNYLNTNFEDWSAKAIEAVVLKLAHLAHNAESGDKDRYNSETLRREFDLVLHDAIASDKPMHVRNRRRQIKNNINMFRMYRTRF